MNILKIKLIGAALLLSGTTAFAQPSYYAVSGIPDASSLVLRAWPSASSQPINNIPHDAVKIETTGKDIFKENKKWLQIMYKNSVGWVEADYLAQMQAPAAPAPAQQIASTSAPQPQETLNKAAAFNYAQQTAALTQQVIPEGIPWSKEADTIYHDPTPQQFSADSQIEVVDATHTLVVINKNSDNGDLRGENLEGNRYESIQASMSVMYQP